MLFFFLLVEIIFTHERTHSRCSLSSSSFYSVQTDKCILWSGHAAHSSDMRAPACVRIVLECVTCTLFRTMNMSAPRHLAFFRQCAPACRHVLLYYLNREPSVNLMRDCDASSFLSHTMINRCNTRLRLFKLTNCALVCRVVCGVCNDARQRALDRIAACVRAVCRTRAHSMLAFTAAA